MPRSHFSFLGVTISLLAACSYSATEIQPVAPRATALGCIASPALDARTRLSALSQEDIERDPDSPGDLDGDGAEDQAFVARSLLGNHGVGPRALYLSRGGCTAFAGVVDNPVTGGLAGRSGVWDVKTFFPNDPCGSHSVWSFDGASYAPSTAVSCTCDQVGEGEPSCITQVSSKNDPRLGD